MNGIFYGVGVGPGDPELMTLKAVRIIQKNEIIALPGKNPRETAAYKIAVQAVPELAKKMLIAIPMPMVMDRITIEKSHREGTDKIETFLQQGKNVVFLTLGDPTIYSTCLYVQKHIQKRGYETELVNGIPSFCAAAACANVSLAEWDEPLHIIPAAHRLNKLLDLPGNYVLMKSGSHMASVKSLLRTSGRNVTMVENCGMPYEKIYHTTEEIPDNAGYYSLIIAKNKNIETMKP